MTDWYDEHIEPGIRDIVRLLRDNGFNTTCSCEHSMDVEGVMMTDGEMKRLHDTLFNNGHWQFSVTYTFDTRVSGDVRWHLSILGGEG